MLHPRFWDLVVCPACKRRLRSHQGGARCDLCAIDYPIQDGIAHLFPASKRCTIDPMRLRIKSREEALRTIALSTRIDAGFLKSPHAYYLLYPLLVIALALAFYPAAIVLGILCLADWLVFILRRQWVLRRYFRSPLRIRTTADMEAVEETYVREGQSQPTMTDWVDAAEEIWAGSTMMPASSTGFGASRFDDERYVEIRELYRARGSPEVVLDVGSSDGRACYAFGIGSTGLYIGVDVSRQLLEKLQARLPGQIAIVGDGGRLPLRDGTIDFLFATETLEHLTDPDAAVREFVRVLSPGGFLVIQSPSAHRLRNLNPFHLLQLLLGFLIPRILLRKVVHENTWHNGVTYHWDFTLGDYRRMINQNGLRRIEISSRGVFVPRSLLRGDVRRFRLKERILRSLPVVRYLGEDLVLVAEKVG